MLHQLMWECCWSLTANKYYVYGLDMTVLLSLLFIERAILHADILRHDKTIDQTSVPTLAENSTHSPTHPSFSHLNLVDVGGVVPMATELRGSLAAAVRHFPGVCLIADPGVLCPVG